MSNAVSSPIKAFAATLARGSTWTVSELTRDNEAL